MAPRRSLCVAAAALITLTAGSSALEPYAQTFEDLDQASPSALGDDGWLVFANVSDPGGGYLYGYGPFAAPNSPAAFSQIALGEGGTEQGAQVLNTFSDYENGDHAVGNLIEANVFQEQTIDAADVGSTWKFRFQHKRGNIEGETTALAFIKTLDPDAGFALTNFLSVDMTSIPDTWAGDSLEIVIDESLEGQILQIGFSNTATNYEGSGIFYDNVDWDESATSGPTLETYTQDFEGLDQADPDALGNDGWLVFGNVSAPDGTYLYGYGPFAAPNSPAAFSQIALGQGGDDQGDQVLNVFSDYENGDHAVGNLIESNVFQEQVIPAGALGSTWCFSFQHKRGNIEGETTALAFIKTLDPGAGFALTNFITVDMTSIPDTWSGSSIEIGIDSSLPGQILQFGFACTATNYEGSGIFYDNVVFEECAALNVPDTQAQVFAHLSQNAPNPFALATRIEFSLERASDVRLTVFDVSGRQVATLSRGQYAAGSHQVIWDGNTQSGSPAPSGVYWYTLRTETGEIAERMILSR